ncbi:baseplate J/gp47 family protein [Spirosoma sp. BT702]|uniref:Baseplate J/gp47 family protein n=1 Tax=Spirosoma profusum TaxID=2771354 RepID=A0A926XZ10_9BACT|nr:baseplate J/gp47 family protein [Spirosoma profusum]MBD2700757.1 baseplate J/gp47 family protein [Spirosoma profusum]
MAQDFRPNELLRNDGTNQLERMMPTLEPTYAKVDERTPADFLKYAYQFAKEIRYYNNQNQPEGDWTPFFDYFLQDAATGDMRSLPQITRELDSRSDLPPHLVLFLTFLKLYTHAQQDLNNLTQKHLDYYYRTILGIKPKLALADTAHVVFELARQIPDFRIPQGTLLDAGKDSDGNPIRYQTERDIVINQARVASLKTLFIEQTPTSGTRIQVAQKADATPSWRPFGTTQTNRPSDEQLMTAGSLGIAISTPNLLLSEGTRTVSLSVSLANTGLTANSLGGSFRLYFSGEKGWIEPDSISEISIKISGDTPVLFIRATLSAIQPAIVAYDDEVLNEGYITPFPILKLILNQEFSQYESLKNLIINSIRIRVAVNGVKSLVVQNEESLVDPAKPFMAFGSQPTLGSSLYIGSEEILTKRLTSLLIRIEWHKLPPHIDDYYEGYFPPSQNPLNQNSFGGNLFFLSKGQWQLLAPNFTLFSGTDGKLLTISVDNSLFRNFDQNREIINEPIESFNIRTNSGFVRLELDSPRFPLFDFEAFGHALFPILYAQRAVALSRFTGAGDPPVLPNQPYTPQIKSLSIDYVSEETFTPNPTRTDNLFWYIEPFGHRDLVAGESVMVLPPISGVAHSYIGLERFTPPQTISLLVQTEDGTAQANTPADLLSSRDITWSYLAGDRWIDIATSDVLAESTEGFQKAGIVMLDIGRRASTQHTLMPSGLVWIRARVDSARKADGASNVRAIRAQAVEVVFTPSSPTQTPKAIAANTIKKVVTPQAAIRSVEQPFASFGGRPAETDTSYYTRVSERLRHKNRLSGSWDYEHLILEAFPEVFKVRCLPHRQPGQVQLIAVPNLRHKNYGNPLEPRCSTVLLRRIEDFLKPFMSTFVKATVSNPTYEQILLDFKVSFRAGKDAGYFAKVLNDEIIRFLSPWAFEEGRDIPFGGRVYKSDLLAFVEERDYVDFVTEFSMYHLYPGPPRGGIHTMTIGKDFFINQPISATINGSTGGAIGSDFVIGQPVDSTLLSPDSPAIIVSAAQHRITSLSADELAGYGTDRRSGVGYMVIGLDFDVTV